MALAIAAVHTLACSAGWRNYHFLKLQCSDGSVGWAEYDEEFGNPGISAVIAELEGRIVGRPVHAHERLIQELHCATRPGAGGVVGQALGAIENALLDAKAKVLGVPCCELLGGAVRDRVRTYWSHCGTWRISRPLHYRPVIEHIDGVRALGREVRECGFDALKTNVYTYRDGKPQGWATGWGIPFAPELNVELRLARGLREHLAAFRDGAGADADILLDLNFNARTEGYARILREIADLDLFWVEIDTRSPRALAHLRALSRHPIASGETLMGLAQFLPFFEQQALDVAIIDLIWNGAWQSLKIAAAAEAHEVNVACHNFYGHLATMMNLHFCAAVPNLRIMETDVDRIAWDAELFTHEPRFEQGCLVVPDRPGWGTEPIEAALAAHPPNRGVNPIGLITRGRGAA